MHRQQESNDNHSEKQNGKRICRTDERGRGIRCTVQRTIIDNE